MNFKQKRFKERNKKIIERKKKRTARIGIFAVAHATYWEQFEGLEQNIMGFHADVCSMVEKNDVEIIDFGMFDSSEKAYAAVPKIMAANYPGTEDDVHKISA